MKYYVNSVKIEKFINNCNGYIEELKNESLNMKSLIEKPKWKGNAYDAVSQKYNKTISNIDKMIEELSLYIKFMEIVLRNYGEGTEKIMKEFQKIVEELEMEKLKNAL